MTIKGDCNSTSVALLSDASKGAEVAMEKIQRRSSQESSSQDRGIHGIHTLHL